jgi:hypothetical protein
MLLNLQTIHNKTSNLQYGIEIFKSLYFLFQLSLVFVDFDFEM